MDILLCLALAFALPASIGWFKLSGRNVAEYRRFAVQTTGESEKNSVFDPMAFAFGRNGNPEQTILPELPEIPSVAADISSVQLPSLEEAATPLTPSTIELPSIAAAVSLDRPPPPVGKHSAHTRTAKLAPASAPNPEAALFADAAGILPIPIIDAKGAAAGERNALYQTAVSAAPSGTNGHSFLQLKKQTHATR